MRNREFKKEMKRYEKCLKEKAKRGVLSLPEKEEYERICRNKYRNSLFEGEKVTEVIGAILVGILVLTLGGHINIGEIGNRVREIMGTQATVKVQGNLRDIYISEINAITNSMNTMNEIVNESIQYYNTYRYLPQEYVDKIEKISVISNTSSGAQLLNIHNQYQVSAKNLMMYLAKSKSIDSQYIATLIEELNKLTKQYQQKHNEIIL